MNKFTHLPVYMWVLLESYAKTLAILCYYYWKSEHFFMHEYFRCSLENANHMNMVWNMFNRAFRSHWKYPMKFKGISHMVIIMWYIINADSANFKLASSLVDFCAPVLRVHKRRDAISWSISRSEVDWRGIRRWKVFWRSSATPLAGIPTHYHQ